MKNVLAAGRESLEALVQGWPTWRDAYQGAIYEAMSLPGARPDKNVKPAALLLGSNPRQDSESWIWSTKQLSPFLPVQFKNRCVSYIIQLHSFFNRS